MKIYTPFLASLLLTCLACAGVARAADITFYERENFRGQEMNVDTSAPNFERLGINDRASSVRVRGGSWQVCSDNFFRGTCVTLPPGNYPSLRSIGLSRSISSAREVGWADKRDWRGREGRPGDQNREERGPGYGAREERGQPYDPSHDSPDRRGPGDDGRRADGRADAGKGGWGTASRAILYSGANLSGRALVVDNEVVADLAPTGFNDRAMSLRVEGGYWVFCSDANFQGTCRTFPPGDYPTLGGMSNAISSGRRISNDYPYSSRPRWQPN